MYLRPDFDATQLRLETVVQDGDGHTLSRTSIFSTQVTTRAFRLMHRTTCQSLTNSHFSLLVTSTIRRGRSARPQWSVVGVRSYGVSISRRYRTPLQPFLFCHSALPNTRRSSSSSLGSIYHFGRDRPARLFLLDDIRSGSFAIRRYINLCNTHGDVISTCDKRHLSIAFAARPIFVVRVARICTARDRSTWAFE